MIYCRFKRLVWIMLIYVAFNEIGKFFKGGTRPREAPSEINPIATAAESER